MTNVNMRRSDDDLMAKERWGYIDIGGVSYISDDESLLERLIRISLLNIGQLVLQHKIANIKYVN